MTAMKLEIKLAGALMGEILIEMIKENYLEVKENKWITPAEYGMSPDQIQQMVEKKLTREYNKEITTSYSIKN